MSATLDLSSIHVSADMRGRGIGAELFAAAAGWARAHGARKLYISAHLGGRDTGLLRQAGLRGRRQAREGAHVEREPFDCQLEFRL